jgi:hypothetical protein
MPHRVRRCGAGTVDRSQALWSAAGQVRSCVAWIRGAATVMSDDEAGMRRPSAPLRMAFRPSIAGIGFHTTMQTVPHEGMAYAACRVASIPWTLAMGMTCSLQLRCAALGLGEGSRGGDRTRLHHGPRARKSGGSMRRGRLQPFVQKMGNRHHTTAGPPTPIGGHPPRGRRGEGGIYRSGIPYHEFRFSRRPAAGARETGRR